MSSKPKPITAQFNGSSFVDLSRDTPIEGNQTQIQAYLKNFGGFREKLIEVFSLI